MHYVIYKIMDPLFGTFTYEVYTKRKWWFGWRRRGYGFSTIEGANNYLEHIHSREAKRHNTQHGEAGKDEG